MNKKSIASILKERLSYTERQKQRIRNGTIRMLGPCPAERDHSK